jgi:hypothetical protein
MLVRRLRLVEGLSRLLLAAGVIIAAVLLGRVAMRLCGFFVVLGGFLMRILRHVASLLCEGSLYQRASAAMVPN